ncbi:MAG: hypothetical protein AAB538_03000, partial [Patescibacteria group bacterium]
MGTLLLPSIAQSAEAERTIPEVRILPGFFLQEMAYNLTPYVPGRDATPQQLAERAEQIAQLWAPHEKAILQGMVKAVGLDFRHNLIDAHVLDLFPTFSRPL